MSGVSGNKPPQKERWLLAGCSITIGPANFPWALKGSEEGGEIVDSLVARRQGSRWDIVRLGIIHEQLRLDYYIIT